MMIIDDDDGDDDDDDEQSLCLVKVLFTQSYIHISTLLTLCVLSY